MKTRYLAGLMVVLLSWVTIPVKACCEGDPPGNPACYECRDGAWVLKAGAECGKDSDCPGKCHICVSCLCVNDDSKCNTNQCCIGGNCVDPICDNCHSVSEVLWECYHGKDDPNGTPCLRITCIQNVLNSATCDYKGPDWTCPKSRCDTTWVFPLQGEIIQTIHDSPCTGGTVNRQIWKSLYYGCTGCNLQPWQKSCEVFWCANNPIPDLGGPRGDKKKCGCY